METSDAVFALRRASPVRPSMNGPAQDAGSGDGGRKRRPRPAGCLMYKDEQLVPLASAIRPAATYGLLADLLEAPSSVARQRLVRAMLHVLGFQWLAYGTMRVHGRGWRPTSFLTTYANPEWVEDYFGGAHYEVDTRLPAVPPSGLPVAWDLQDLRSQPLPAARATAHRMFAQALERTSQRCGLLLALPCAADRNEQTFIGLTSAAPTRAWIDDNVMRQSTMLALCLHDFLSLHVRVEADPASAA